ncbi:hypothetical protein RB195_020708 [Necator americanus]
MICRSLIAFAVIIHQISSQNLVIVEGHRPSRVIKSQRRHNISKRANVHDSAKDVIYAPLDGQRVITKGIYYVNGRSKTEDEIYESVLLNGSDSTDGIDPFFVTRPPHRTTVAVKYNIHESTPQQSINSVDEVEEEIDGGEVEQENPRATTRYPLRLVTIPPRSTTALPPFKHVSRRIIQRKEDNISTTTTDSYASQGVRFPVESFQIPSNTLVPVTLNPNPNLSPPPPNPFLPIMPVRELNITYPFLPIGRSNPMPPYSPPMLISPAVPPFGNGNLIHRSSLRQGSYVRGREVPAIPLPSTPALVSGSAYVRTENEQYPYSDFLIDGGSRSETSAVAVAKPHVAKHIRPRSISGPYREHRDEQNSSEQLRLFARNHPNIVKSMTKKTFVKENLLILPKSYNVVGQIPTSSRARTTLTPNEKLDLCCRKRRVSPGCQAMCNFEALNDKTMQMHADSTGL